MSAAVDIDSVLLAAGWEQWRSVHSRDAGTLAAGARHWCASTYWAEHTPQLENWKLVVNDLRGDQVSEQELERMSATGRHPIPFPPIPLFEDEQVRDLCGVLQDLDAAAALAECLHTQEFLLTVDRSSAGKLCWDSLPLSLRKDLEYSTWVWLFSVSPLPSLPPAAAVRQLLRLTSPRATAALQRLRDAVQSRGGVTASDTEVAELAVILSPPQNRQEPDMFAQSEYSPLVQLLFDGSDRAEDWERVQAAIAARNRRESAGLHPLLEMTQYLRTNDFPAAWDDQGWRSLRWAFEQFPMLLDLDGVDPQAPLPALELACSIRSRVAPGRIALDLLPFAGERRQSERWWAAVSAALLPSIRRGGWLNANDCWATAAQAIRLAAWDLDEAERAAMIAGFSGEPPERTYA